VEFQIMELFFHNPGIALVREKILKGVWGENYFGDVKIVDVNIRRLRMKVEDEPSHPTHIMTVWEREKILKGVWGENYFGDVKIVDVNIRRLRMKVEDEPSHPTHIMTVWGYGYRWEE
jgi:DNA-binding response OmpR family regulator